VGKLEKNIDKYANVKINYTTRLPLYMVDKLRMSAATGGEKATYIIENALKEYFKNHNIFSGENTETA